MGQCPVFDGKMNNVFYNHSSGFGDWQKIVPTRELCLSDDRQSVFVKFELNGLQSHQINLTEHCILN